MPIQIRRVFSCVTMVLLLLCAGSVHAQGRVKEDRETPVAIWPDDPSDSRGDRRGNDPQHLPGEDSTLFPSPNAGTFTLEPSNLSVQLTKGITTSINIRVIPSGGFSDPVQITTSGSIQGGNVSNSPAIISPPYDQTSTILLSATNATPSGQYSISILGQAGTTTVSTGLFVNVVAAGEATFGFSLFPNNVDVVKGSGFATSVETFTTGSFTTPINYSISGLPAGVTVTGLPQTLQAPYADIPVVFSATSSAVPGTYTTTVVTGTAGSLTLTKPVTIVVRGTAVGEYSFHVDPVPIFVTAGGRQLLTLTVTSFGGFSGVVTVNHAESHPSIFVLNKNCPLSGGPSCPIQNIPLNVPAGGSVSEQVLVSVTPTSPGGSIIFTTSTPGLPDEVSTYSVDIGAQPPGFDLHADPVNPTIAQGQSRQITVTLTRLDGFTGAVPVEVTAQPGFTFAEPLPIIFAPGETSKPLTLQVGASVTPATNYTVNLFASVPSISASTGATIVVNVTPAPSAGNFFLFPTPGTITAQQGQSGTTTINLTRSGGFTGPVTVDATIAGGPVAGSGYTITPALPFTFAAGETTKQVTITPDTTVPVGTHTVTFMGTASGIGTRNCNVLVNVTAAPLVPDFTFAVTPNPVSVTQNASTTATATITRSGGFNGDVNVSGTTGAQGVTIGSVTIPAGQTTATLTIVATSSATTGPSTINFSAAAPSIPKTLTSVINLTVVAQQAPADFTINVAPSEIQVNAGGTGLVTMTLTRQNFTGNVTVNATGGAGITITPQTFTFSGTTTQAFNILVAPDAPAGRTPISFTATSTALPGVTRSASAGVTVIPVSTGAPIISSITPSALVAGAQRAVVVLAGRNFVAGAQIFSNRTDVVVESAEIQSDSIAIVVVTVNPFAEAGPTTFRLRNPNGLTTAQGVELIVYEEGDIGAPLGVTAAAILSPLGGKIVTNVDRPYATGVVATSGTGTISGRWLFDGGTFDSFTITVSAGEPAMVTSRVPLPSSHAGPHQLQLVIDVPQQAQSAAIAIRMAIDSASNLTILGPVGQSGGSGNAGDAMTLRWSMVPGAQGYVVELTREGQPFPSQVEVGQEAELPIDAADLPTGGGPVRWRVAPMYCCSGNDSYAGTFSDWSDLPLDRSARGERELFESIRDTAIAEAMTPRLKYQLARLAASDSDENLLLDSSTYQLAQGTAPARTGAAGTKSSLRSDWSVVPMATSTYTRHATDQDGSIQLSGQGDLGLPPLASKYTTDFTGANIYGDDFTFRGSRNWIVNVGNAKASKRVIRPEATFGYGPPDFFRGAQLVTSSLARGGALGRVSTRFGSLAYYSTFTDALDGVIGGNFGMQQKLDAVALEFHETKKLSFKIISMHVEDLPLASQSAPRGEGRSLGFLTSYKVSPKLQLVAEASRGRGEWTTRDGLREREGDAFRIGMSGMRGRTSYRADFNHTDSDYANPGNRGFTAASIPNRTGGSLSITRPVGRGSATLALKHQTQTRSSITADATGLNLSYNLQLKPSVSLSATANTNVDSADADTQRRLPGTDRQQRGGTVTLSERYGRLNLSQTLAHQRLNDDVNLSATNNVTTLTLSGGGTIVPNFNLFATSTVIHSAAAPTVGDGDNITFSLQPSFAIPRLNLSLQPRLSYNFNDNDFRRTSNRGEQYAALMQWSPDWFNKIGALQLSSNWNRTEDELQGRTNRSLNRSYVGTFTLKWGEGVGADMFRRHKLPGELPVTGRQGASQDPINGRTSATAGSRK